MSCVNRPPHFAARGKSARLSRPGWIAMMGGKVDQFADAVSETKCFKSCSNIPSSSRCAAVRGTPRWGLRQAFSRTKTKNAGKSCVFSFLLSHKRSKKRWLLRGLELWLVLYFLRFLTLLCLDPFKNPPRDFQVTMKCFFYWTCHYRGMEGIVVWGPWRGSDSLLDGSNFGLKE